MSEMINRVAKALDAIEIKGGGLPSHEEYARAAIEAMREPTDNMCAVANGIHFPDNVWRAMIQEALEP